MNSVRSKNIWAFMWLCLAFIVLVGFLHAAHGIPLLSASPYNTYTLQAMAWRDGRTYLKQDVPHLELAIFEGRYYVSFPPVPSVPVFLFTFLFGQNVPDGLLIKLYLLGAMLLLYAILSRRGVRPLTAAGISFAFCLASSMLPLVLTGAVWYQAQVLAFLLIIAAMERMDAGYPAPSLLLYALSVGCRPLNVFYGPLLLAWGFGSFIQKGHSFKESVKKLLPGILLGLLVAASYAVYNAVRFRNPLEFGHNHLPEFSFQGGQQFSLSHIQKNLNTFFFALPFELVEGRLAFRQFGFSLFLSNPLLLLLLIWVILDLFSRRITPSQLAITFCFVIHLFCLLMHRTFGGFQYGARYAVDLIPYAVLYFLTQKRRRLLPPEWVLLGLGLALSLWGSLVITL